MKYIVVLGDGMADRPLKELGGRTPLEHARTPAMDFIAREGRSGLLKTLSEDMPLGSDIANMSVLGYDPKKYYTGGRGPLEAASMGVCLGEDDIALRCNIITQGNGTIIDHSGGHITSDEAFELIAAVKEETDSNEIEFYPGVSYRHLAVLRGKKYSPYVKYVPPHDVIGESVSANLPESLAPEGDYTAKYLKGIMMGSQDLFENHPVNLKRKSEGKSPANMLWMWGAGRRLDMPSFHERFGMRGALISAVDLLKGLAVYAGLDVIEVKGATGYLDTDYEAKADAALKALQTSDFIYIHVEAPDEAGHEGNIEKKITAIEDLDNRLIKRLLDAMEGEDFCIAVLPDHATPIEVKTHTVDPVPFAVYCKGIKGDRVSKYSERDAANGSFGLCGASDVLPLLFGIKDFKDV